MKPGRSRSLPLASFAVAGLALFALAVFEFGLVGSPFGGVEGSKAEAKRTPKPKARVEAIKRPDPVGKPTEAHGSAPLPEVVHAEEADEPSTRPMPPARPAPAVKPGDAKDSPDARKVAKHWRERLGLLHRRMHNRGVDAEAIARKAMDEVDEITDPRAAPALWHVFAGHPAHHLMVARRLAELESPRSSLMLAALAAYSPDAKAWRAAVDGLTTRDPSEFAAPLIALLGPELKYRMGTLPTGPGEPLLQALEIEDERFIKQFVYFAGTRPGDASSGAFGEMPAMPCERDLARAELTQELADQQLRSDIDAIEALNRRIRTLNDRVHATLAEATGRDYRLDRDAWYGWLASKMGKTYVPPERVAKVQLRDFVEPIYQPTFVEVPPVPS